MGEAYEVPWHLAAAIAEGREEKREALKGGPYSSTD